MIERLVYARNFCPRQRKIRLAASLDADDVNRPTGALAIVEVARYGEVIGNPVLVVEFLEEDARFLAVVERLSIALT
jgi:hypothetical protein